MRIEDLFNHKNLLIIYLLFFKYKHIITAKKISSSLHKHGRIIFHRAEARACELKYDITCKPVDK